MLRAIKQAVFSDSQCNTLWSITSAAYSNCRKRQPFSYDYGTVLVYFVLSIIKQNMCILPFHFVLSMPLPGIVVLCMSLNKWSTNKYNKGCWLSFTGDYQGFQTIIHMYNRCSNYCLGLNPFIPTLCLASVLRYTNTSNTRNYRNVIADDKNYFWNTYLPQLVFQFSRNDKSVHSLIFQPLINQDN